MKPHDRLPWTLRHRRATLGLCILAMLLGIASALTLRPGTAVRDMLPAQSPAAAALERVLTDFRLIDDLMVLVERPADDDNAEPDPAPLRRFAESLRAALAEHDDIAYVRFDRADAQQQAAFVEDLAWRDAWFRLDPTQQAGVRERLEPQAMRDTLQRRAAELAAPGNRPPAWADALRNDPLGLLTWLGADPIPPRTIQPAANRNTDLAHTGLDLSDDGRALLIRIGGVRPANDLAYSRSLVQRVNEAIEAQPNAGLTWQLTGPHAIANFSASATQRDMIVSIIVSLVLLSLLFFIVYRDHRTLPMTLLTVNGGIVVAFGLYALGQGRLSPVTATCGAVLAGLGIDYCVHLVAHLRGRRAEDWAQALRTMTPVLGAACVTSAIGFAAVSAAGVRALTEFAVLGVLGLAATLAMTLTFLPAALTASRAAPPPALRPMRSAALVAALFHRPRPWLFGCAMIAGMAGTWLIFAPGHGLRFADDLEAMHARPNPPLEAQAEITRRFGVRPSVLLIHLQADSPTQLLQHATAAQTGLRQLAVQHPHLHQIWGLADLLAVRPPSDATPRPDPQATLDAFDAAVADSVFQPAIFATFRDRLALALDPDATDPWATLREARERVEPLLPRGFFEGEPATQALLVATLDTPWELLGERAALLADLRTAISDVPGASLTGLAVVGAEMQDALRTATGRLVWVVSLAVVVWLCLFFRNPWEVLASLFPAGVGLLVLTAAIGVFQIELHAANLIALPLTLGLGVDDGIFLVAAARRVRRAGGTIAELREALAGATGAVVLTSVTTLLAFGSLAFTRTPAIQSLGLLAAIGVTACLLATLLGLLPLLALSHTRRSSPRHTP